MVGREAAGLEHDTAKATERRCGGIFHFLNNGANEAKLGQKNVFSRNVEDIRKHQLLWSKLPKKSNK